LILQGGEVSRLTRVPFIEKGFSESWLQKLLFDHPELIPVEEIEPIFGPLTPIARELRTDAGAVDLVYVNPDGFVTLVETKLWRNPQARREVVAQIIDYAKCLASYSYDDLRGRVCAAAGRGSEADPVVEALAQADDAFDGKRYSDTMAKNLRLGRFLLLIVGDGIQEGVEEMAEFLAKTPNLAFTLALVEVGLFRPAEHKEPLIIQPRIVARTREVVRAVVEIRAGTSPDAVRVTLPAGSSRSEGRPRSITEDEYYDRLKATGGPEAVEFVKEMVESAASNKLEVIWSTRGPALRYVDEDTGHTFKLVRFRHDGTLDISAMDRACTIAGISRDIAADFLKAVRSVVPGSVIETYGEKDTRRLRLPSGELASIASLAPRRGPWLAAVQRVVDRIEKAFGTIDRRA
jgi:hypothetical protein